MQHSLFQRAINKAIKETLNLVGVDRLTLEKAHKRSDLKTLGNECTWTVPDILGENSVCYCVGCGVDVSFDLALIEYFGCDVHAFDPTPKAVKYVTSTVNNPKYHFNELGVWHERDTLKFYMPINKKDISFSLLNLQKSEDYIEAKVDSLKNIMSKRGHDKIDLLKLDIEGAEYKVIQSILDEEIPVKILCVEYDEYFNPLDENYKSRIKQSFYSLLSNGYKMIFTENNANYTFMKD